MLPTNKEAKRALEKARELKKKESQDKPQASIITNFIIFFRSEQRR